MGGCVGGGGGGDRRSLKLYPYHMQVTRHNISIDLQSVVYIKLYSRLY